MKSRDKSKIYVPIVAILFILSFAGFVFSLFWLNPTRLGPGGVTFWFINFFLLCTTLVTLLFFAFLKRLPKYVEHRSQCFYRSIRSGFVIGLSLTVLLALSSLRSLSWRDFVLFIIIVAVIEVLFRTRRATV